MRQSMTEGGSEVDGIRLTCDEVDIANAHSGNRAHDRRGAPEVTERNLISYQPELRHPREGRCA